MFRIKYRILTNGKGFRIQTKTTFFWLTGQWSYGCTDRGIYKYDTKKAAEDDILKMQGKHPDQQWRIAE